MVLPQKIRIAIVAPTTDSYSETFIRAHKRLLAGNIFYYYGGFVPTILEGEGYITQGIFKRIKFLIRNFFGKSAYSFAEYCFAESLIDNGITVVLAEYGYTGAEILKVCKKLSIPMVVHFHGADASHHETIEKYKEKYKELFNYSSSIIAVSKVMHNALVQLGCSSSKLVYNPYGPADEFLSITPHFLSKSFLFVGRFVDKKAPYFLILSFSLIAKKFPEAKLYMAGDGYLLQVCKDLVNFLGLNDRISFCGVLNRTQLISKMKDSLALVQHSKTALSGDSEGTPVIVLEAQAAGLPVIATRHAGINDVVVHNESGFLVEENDVSDFARYMELMLSMSQEECNTMSNAAKTVIRERFPMDKHIAKINNLLTEAHAGAA